MSTDYEKILKVAKSSLDNSGEEWTRSAISRSYYSMYHSALRLLNGKSIPRDNSDGKAFTGTHKRLSDHLCCGDAAKALQADENVIEKIGMKMRASHISRCEADYDLKSKINRINALKIIADTEAMNEQITNILS